MKKNEKPTWDNLIDLLEGHIAAAVEKRLTELKAIEGRKIFLTLPEVEHRIGIKRAALRKRFQRGTLKLHRASATLLLMPIEEYDRLVEEIRKAG